MDYRILVVNLVGFVFGYVCCWFIQRNIKSKAGTPSASHNSQSTKSHWQWLPVGSGFDPTKEHDGIEIKRR